MEKKPYELLARFAANGNVQGVSVRYVFVIDNKTIEGDPEPLTGTNDLAFFEFATLFSAAIVAERDSLSIEKRILENRIASLENDKNNLTSNVQELNDLKNERVELMAQLAVANEKIAALLAQMDFNPRIIEANAFLNRISSTELAELFSSTDPNVKDISAMLLSYKANDWRIELDSVQFQTAVGYLRQIGMITDERLSELLRDGSRVEAYVDDGSR